MKWEKMDSAPRDGSAFLVQYLPYSTAVLCMRRVRFDQDRQGNLTIEDLGAWIQVGGIRDDIEYGPTDGKPEWAVAEDRLNNTMAWRWSKLPQAPATILAAIREDLGWDHADDAVLIGHQSPETLTS
jgi:hypothetical protein